MAAALAVAGVSSASVRIVASSPVNDVQPMITSDRANVSPIYGFVGIGDHLTVSDGTWENGPNTFTYQWSRCDSGSGCTAIAGATQATYIPVAADGGKSLRVVVTATNSTGSATAAAPATKAVGVPGLAYANGAATYPITESDRDPWDEVDGFVDVGDTLTVSSGTWLGDPTISYQWIRCPVSSTCSDITGATGASYTVVEADRGDTLHVVVTAGNVYGSTTYQAPAGSTVGYPTPTSLKMTSSRTSSFDAYSGYVDVGDVLTLVSGAWLGNPTSITYRWQRCDQTTFTCSDIAGATGTSYTAAEADRGSRLQLLITATNTSGTDTETVGAGGTVGLPALGSDYSTHPKVTSSRTGSILQYGDFVDAGDVLTVSNGTWLGSPTSFAYRWRRCTVTFTCTDITGATNAAYTVVTADRGNTLQVVVTATNAAGSATDTESAGGSVGLPALASGFSSRPAVTSSRDGFDQYSGFVDAGDVLTVSDGTWLGSPTSIGYQWQRCDSTGFGGSCTAISGATHASYSVVAGDRGSSLQVVVTATNSVGSSTSTASAGGTVGAPALAGGSSLSVITSRTGSAVGYSDFVGIGETLTVTGGTWLGDPSSITYQWKRCDESFSCVNAGTTATHDVVSDDLGTRLQVVVTATNSVGSADTTLYAGGVVGAPALDVYPQMTSSRGSFLRFVDVGDTLTTGTGTWLGAPTSYTYRWQRCASSGGSCVDIAGALSATYVVVSADRGFRLQAIVTATNAVDSTDTTVYGGPAVGLPAADDYPKVTSTRAGFSAYDAYQGFVDVGDTLTVGTGTWFGAPTSFAYQWQRCVAETASCTDIAGATGSSHTVVLDDRTWTLQVIVTATNSVGSTPATAPAGSRVGVPTPASVEGYPSVTSSRSDSKLGYADFVDVGDVLTAAQGTWAGSPTTIAFQWQRCPDNGSCTAIAGADAATYTVQAADLGDRLQVDVSATNAVGTGTIRTNAGGRVGVPSAATSLVLRSSRGGAFVGYVAPGDVLTLDPVVWLGSPTSVAYTWQRCTAGPTCTSIPGANSTSYTVQPADSGFSVQLQVTATNANGTGTFTAYGGQTVGAPQPRQTSDGPSLTGFSTDSGDTLTLNAGAWNYPTGAAPTFSYAWQRCSGSGDSLGTCSAIGGATNASYQLVDADIGHTVIATITASNAYGTGTYSSSRVAGAPQSLTDPEITGTPAVGQTLTASYGTWRGHGGIAPTLAIQWWRCPANGDCAEVAGATGTTYVPTADDGDATLYVVVTATGALGAGTTTTQAYSAETDPVGPAGGPVAPGAPTSVSAASGDGAAIVSFTPPASTGGAAITSYTVTSSPGGVTATGSGSPITVTGLNSAGTGPASAASAAVIPRAPAPGAPTGVAVVVGDGTATVSFTPSASGGPATSYSVTASPGAITATGSGSPITLTGLTNGTSYTFVVTATNAAGTSAASASATGIPTDPATPRPHTDPPAPTVRTEPPPPPASPGPRVPPP